MARIAGRKKIVHAIFSLGLCSIISHWIFSFSSPGASRSRRSKQDINEKFYAHSNSIRDYNISYKIEYIANWSEATFQTGIKWMHVDKSFKTQFFTQLVNNASLQNTRTATFKKHNEVAPLKKLEEFRTFQTPKGYNITVPLLNRHITNKTFVLVNSSHISIRDIISLNVTFQDWCKTYQRKNTTFAKYMDKYNVKHLLPTLTPNLKFAKLYAKVNNCSRIDEKLLERLPKRYMMKATHLSGGIVRVSGDNVTCIKNPWISPIQNETKIQYMQRLCNAFLKQNYWARKGEMMYKEIPKRILFEQDLSVFGAIQEYRFWIFNEKPLFIHINSNRIQTDLNYKKNFRTLDWKELIGMSKIGHLGDTYYRQNLSDQPLHFYQELVGDASKLGQLFKMARLDFFVFRDTYWFSEVTACDQNCYSTFSPDILNYFFGYILQKPEVPFDFQAIMKMLT